MSLLCIVLQRLLFPFYCCSVAESCPTTLCDSMDCSIPGFPDLHNLPGFAQTHVHCVEMPSNHLILRHPLLLFPSLFPSIRVFSDKSAPHTRWPKYWSFSISASYESSGLISFRIYWFDLLAAEGTLKSLL